MADIGLALAVIVGLPALFGVFAVRGLHSAEAADSLPSVRTRSIAAGLIVVLIVGGGAAVAKNHKHGRPRGPYPSLGSCQVFPKPSVSPKAPALDDESAWNQDISQAPLDPNSAAYISFIDSHEGNMLQPDFGSTPMQGYPYSVTRRAKKIKVRFTVSDSESTHGAYRVPPNVLIAGGKNGTGDRHVLSVDARRCKLDELYRAFLIGKGRKRHWNADSGVIWDLNSAALRTDGFTSADAAGLPIFPGLVRFDEAQSGSIDHAIRVTFRTTRDAWVHPALHCTGSSTSSAAPPMGLRLRLKASYDTPGVSGSARTIATALKHYGLIVADNGFNWHFGGTSDRRWNDENLNQLTAIPGSAFEVVQSAAPIHVC